MKTKNKVAVICFVIVFSLIGWGYFNIWRSPTFFIESNTCEEFLDVLTMKEYGEIVDEHARPFIINGKSTFVFGSEHTKDPDNFQIAEIEDAMNEFKPTAVLVEGRLGFLIPYLMNPVKNYGEMGKAAEIAKKNDLLLFSWDAPKSEELDALRGKFSLEQVAMKEILNPYFSNLRYGKPESPENYVEQYIYRAEWLGVQNTINSINDVDRLWARDFSSEMDWREVSDQWGLPGYLGEIADYSNFIRNQHLMCAISKLVDQGERVFVICGSSHAVCIENHII